MKKTTPFYLFSLVAMIAMLFCVALTSAEASVSGFVTRSGNRLTLNGSAFRFSGANIYWLGLDENVGGVAYPTNFRVDDALSTAAEMGANVVRAHTLGISVGNSLSVEPTLGNFNASAFTSMDYAIKSAGDRGIRLVIPLTDQYNYYTGGELTFCGWRGSTNQNDFYSNSTIISDFEQYVSTILNHVNTLTGVAYKNDPTIMAWETGNEIHPTVAWTQTISNYIKSIDANHLIVDGTYGVNSSALSLSNVDIYSDHYYPLNATTLASDANTVGTAGKVFLVGEYAWNNGDLSGFLSTASSNANVAGDFYWSLFGHLDTYGFVQHNDGYTVHYPGDTSAMQTGVLAMRSHAYGMRGLSVPAYGTPLTPQITSISTAGAIAWRGAAIGATYQVERATAGSTGPWTTITTGSVTDNGTPWTDATHPTGTVWYRVKAANLSGVFGPYSSVSSITYTSGTSAQFTDPLNDFTLVSSKTANWSIDTTNSANFNGDAGRAMRSSLTTESLTYNKTNITGFTVRIYNNSGYAYTATLAVSPDNSTWTTVGTTVTASGSGAQNWTYQDLTNTSAITAGMNYLRITLSGGSVNWSPQISQVTINYTTQNTPLSDPLNDFTKVYAKSTNWSIDTTNSANFNGDSGRAMRSTVTTESLTYNKTNLSGFTIRIYNNSGYAYTATIAVSPDNSTWTTVGTTVSASGSGAANWTYQDISNSGSVGTGKNYLRITLSGGSVNWSPQISQVTINQVSKGPIPVRS